ncbi:Glyoxylate/hydroxypyruvate reductase B [Klebsiella pneumoniae]|nr:Glyoxylate/hydroxypyruvate reductase B [Klebsiella pneumoniae]
MPKLRATSTVSVGYDNFDVEALNARRVLLMHTPTVLTETVADTVMALVLSTARRVVEVAERVKAGEWTKSIGPDWFGTDVHHKTLGIVGMGRIGMALAQRAHFGSACQSCITRVASIRRRKNASMPAIAISIPCCRRLTLSA